MAKLTLKDMGVKVLTKAYGKQLIAYFFEMISSIKEVL